MLRRIHTGTSQRTNAGPIDERARFDLIRYANCWEDAEILCEALQPSRGQRVLSIASAGDNALALIAKGAEVVAADLSLPQLACLDLRRAAFRRLDYEPLLRFIGVLPSGERLATFARLEDDLLPSTRQFWSEHRGQLARGIIHAGRLEAYFRKFRKFVLPLIHSRTTLRRLVEPKDVGARKRFYDETWDNRRWRLLFRIFFGRFLMGRLGRDPEFFRYVEGAVSDRFLQRAEYALTILPTDSNPFLDYIVHGNFARALPFYLRPEQFDAVRSGLERLTLYHGSIEEAGRLYQKNGFDGFNLSDIFEYLDPDHYSRLYRDLVELARPAARLVYWNTLVARSCPAELIGRGRPLKDLARELFAQDRAFFYSAFEVDEVV